MDYSIRCRLGSTPSAVQLSEGQKQQIW